MLWQRQPDARLGEVGVAYDYYTDAQNKGRKATATYGEVQTQYYYDARGRTDSVATVFADGSLRPTRNLRYRYDLAGNKVSTSVELWQATASQPAFAYATTLAPDASDRIAAVGSKDWNPQTSWDQTPANWTNSPTNTLAQYAYNEVGSLSQVVRPGNVTTGYQYNRRNELAWMTHTAPAGGGDLGEAKAYVYQSDLSGKRTAMFQGTEVSFDGNGVPSPAQGQPGTQYLYDKAGRLVQETRANGQVTAWTFDKAGNRLTQTVTGQGHTAVTTYAYDDNDRLLTEATVTDGTPTLSKSYGWDAKGQMVWSGQQTGANQGTMAFDRQAQYVYTFEGRLGRVWEYGVAQPRSVVFRYDAEGNRVAVGKVTPGANNAVAAEWTYQAVDAGQPYAEVAAEWSATEVSADGGQSWQYGPWRLAARYEFGLDRLRTVQYQTDQSGNVTGAHGYGYLHDGLGSVRALVDAGSGARTDGYDYSAYGEPTTIAGSAGTPNRFLFNGQQFDGAVNGGGIAGLGLSAQVPGIENAYYLRARFYHPGNGRFTSQDPFTGSD